MRKPRTPASLSRILAGSVAAIALAALATTCSTGNDSRQPGPPDGRPDSRNTAMQGPPSGSPPGEARGSPGSSGGQPPSGQPGRDGAGTPAAATLPETATSKYFADLNSTTRAWNAYIDWMKDQGLLDSASTLYRPFEPLVRGDLARFLQCKYKWETRGEGYTDAPQDWARGGKAAGVLDATSAFNPGKAVTRLEAARWMYLAESKAGMPPDFADGNIASLADRSTIAPEDAKAVSAMLRLGLLSADARGMFRPDGTITRAEIAPVLYRLWQLGKGGGNPPAGQPGGPGGQASGGPGGQPPGVSGTQPGGFGPPAASAPDHGTAAHIVSADTRNGTYSSTADNENALRVAGTCTVTVSGARILKDAGQTVSGESSDFYGSNAAFLAMEGASVTLESPEVHSSARGGNALFSWGEGTGVTALAPRIRTTGDNSGGLMVAGGGTLTARDADVVTTGRSSAAIRSDRGGARIQVSGGSFRTKGTGSPAIYSTAAISAANATLDASASEAVVVEGMNSVELTDCIVSGAMAPNDTGTPRTVMVYQSMSGDAAQGTGSFTMTRGSLSGGAGDRFWTTNTRSVFRLERVALKAPEGNGALLRVSGNDTARGWGSRGSNGARCTFTAVDQDLAGPVVVDEISRLTLDLQGATTFTGAINPSLKGGEVTLTMAPNATWTLTADSAITRLEGAPGRIRLNGHRLLVGDKVME